MATTAAILPRARRADAQRNRERILAAGREAFADGGASVRIEEIARRAGVGVGTVYRHFATKEALMATLLRETWESMAEHASAALADDGADPWEAFAGVLSANAELMAADAGARSAVLGSDSPKVWAGSEEARRALLDATAELIARGQAAGAIRSGIDADDVSLAMCGVCATMGVRGPGGAPKDWRRHLDLVLQGFRAG